MVSIPSLAAAKEAESPPGPLPTTRISVFARTGMALDGSSMCCIFLPFQIVAAKTKRNIYVTTVIIGSFSMKNQAVFIRTFS
jgi:hypothetical protein